VFVRGVGHAIERTRGAGIILFRGEGGGEMNSDLEQSMSKREGKNNRDLILHEIILTACM